MGYRKINISNKKGRNAKVTFHAFPKKQKIFYVDNENNEIVTKKYVKNTDQNTINALLAKNTDLDGVASALIKADPELDLEVTGKFLSKTARVYLNTDNKVVYRINKKEKVFSNTGELTEEREPKYLEANTSTETPLVWSGKWYKKSEYYNKYVFVRKYQISHTNSLTYDFLFDIAKELHDQESLMMIGSGTKGTGALVFQDGGNPFRGFLEGRIKNDKYCLILHLSNMELKPLEH